MFLYMTLCLSGLVFQYGNAASECPVHGVTPLIYFDIEQLSLISLQQGFNNVIQQPVLCRNGDDEECSKQQCCHGEVGCCHTKSSGRCGCKKPQDEICSYSAPFAIMANTECEGAKTRKISACWRENRGNEENHILTINKTMQSTGTEAQRNSKEKNNYYQAAILAFLLCQASDGLAC